jgi:hypothetical protein
MGAACGLNDSSLGLPLTPAHNTTVIHLSLLQIYHLQMDYKKWALHI